MLTYEAFFACILTKFARMGTHIPRKLVKELIQTAKTGDVNVFKLIVDSFCSKNENDLSWVLISDKKGRSLVHIASMHGHLTIVSFIRREVCDGMSDYTLRKKYIDLSIKERPII